MVRISGATGEGVEAAGEGVGAAGEGVGARAAAGAAHRVWL